MNYESIELSIIVPVYNTAKYLGECIDSLLKQNLDSYEIIIINDGSTDNSFDIAKKYSISNPYVRVYNQENLGQGAARNKGLRLSKGKYIYFMDSDDILRENTLNTILSKIKQSNSDGVFFDGVSFTDDNYSSDKTINSKYTRSKSYGLFNNGEDLMVTLIKNKEFTVSPCLYIFKKELLDEELLFDEGVILEDTPFTTKLILNMRECEHVNEVCFLRRIRENSTMTGSNDEKVFQGLVNSIKKLDLMYTSHNFKSQTNKKVFGMYTGVQMKRLLILYHNSRIKFNEDDVKLLKKTTKQRMYYKDMSLYLSVNFYSLYNKLRNSM